MSFDLDPLVFPLHGARLIEASAGTGKTWTIAALYVRLVLGHGEAAAFARPLAPAEILVMTFTRAATRELSERIRERLLQTARCFRGQEPDAGDAFLLQLMDAYEPGPQRQQAAHRLLLAAEAMDEAAVFTIDAWCQRMLREHAFDSACLFDEELVGSEEDLFSHAVRDYWRGQVYALDGAALASVRASWHDLDQLEQAMRGLVPRAGLFNAGSEETLGRLVARIRREQADAARRLKCGWAERVARMRQWYDVNRAALNGSRLRQATVAGFFDALDQWAADPEAIRPEEGFGKAWQKMVPDQLADACRKGMAVTPSADFDEVAPLARQLAELEPLEHALLRHAACAVAQRMADLKRHSRQFGFADMLSRLKLALEGANGAALRQRIVQQYPVAMIDEFQDTSPDQYRIFDLLYQVAETSSGQGLFLIGDPKQAIYGFRGADIHSYLAARAATAGRHYRLGTNYRSSSALVAAVNQVFLHAEGQAGEGGHAAGAFHFRSKGANPLPFEPVAASGRKETLVGGAGPVAALTLWCHTGAELKAEDYRAHFGKLCAAQVVDLLNDPAAGFDGPDGFARLRPADIAILVRDRKEARAVRRALQARNVASVYLSDKDSVFQGQEARDILRWLRAIATPLDGARGRAAFAAASTGLSLASLAQLAADDLAWDARVEQLKALRQVWQRQGVLAMLRRFIHELELPAALLRQPGGERRLTNLLHLAELLQAASGQQDGEQALIRWLAEQIAHDSGAGDERILRLESDDELVQVVTVHKSKGLEYPLVFLPYAVSARPVDRRNRSFFEYAGPDGISVIDFSLSQEALAAMDAARLEEDLRLLYVAATRARHALWLGVASLNDRIDQCALGYLLAGGDRVAAADLAERLQAMAADCPHIRIVPADAAPGQARLDAGTARPQLADSPAGTGYAARFERDWSIASYTSITRDTGTLRAPATPLEEKLLEDDDKLPLSGGYGSQDSHGGHGVHGVHDAAWHRFPRGALAGQFLHEQLEWMAQEGFAVIHSDNFDSRLAARCQRAGWGQRQDEAIAWLRAAADAPLPPLGAALCQLEGTLPETEFWLPADGLRTGELDRLCQERLLDGQARPPLQERQLQGMLRGFMDLVFERDGRYWVLDYKSNALGQGDAAYHAQALVQAMARHRYDVQGTIYLLALHRLLKSRLGADYDPIRQLGGAVFYFLRGAMHPATHGCHHLVPDLGLLERLDALFPQTLLEGAAA
jgi:exodeoxyribonuclease V beta subunit